MGYLTCMLILCALLQKSPILHMMDQKYYILQYFLDKLRLQRYLSNVLILKVHREDTDKITDERLHTHVQLFY